MFAGPLAVGASLGLVSFASAGIVPGYDGAGVNPARCFSSAVARRDFKAHWIWWSGPAAGALILAFVDRVAPPYHSIPTDR